MVDFIKETPNINWLTNYHCPSLQAFGAEISHSHLCQLANAADSMPALPIDEGPKLLMMRGMTAPNFDPERYAGRWFEVASFKSGFAGQGQEDCHCTQVNLMQRNNQHNQSDFGNHGPNVNVFLAKVSFFTAGCLHV